MTETRGDYLTRFKPSGDEPLAEKPISVKLPQRVDAAVRSLPAPSAWLRRVISEAVERELLRKPE